MRRKGKVIGIDAQLVRDVSLIPSSAGVKSRTGYSSPRYPKFLGSAPVPVEDASTPSGQARASVQAAVKFKACKPFITRNSRQIKMESLDHLAEVLCKAFSSAPSATIDLLCSQRPWGRLIHLDKTKNDPSSCYHVRWPESKVLEAVPLSDLDQILAAWSSRKVMASMDLCNVHPPPSAHEGWASSPMYPGAAVSRLYIAPCDTGISPRIWSPELKAALSPLCEWLAAYLCFPAARLSNITAQASKLRPPCVTGPSSPRSVEAVAEDASTASGNKGSSSARCSAESQSPPSVTPPHITHDAEHSASAAPAWLPPFSVASVHLECVSAGALMPLKYETVGRLVVQVKGARRMLLVPPAMDGGLAPFPCAHPYDTYSATGMAATACSGEDEALVDHVAGLWPAFKQVRGSTCILVPGDVLYIPPYWSTHSEVLTGSIEVGEAEGGSWTPWSEADHGGKSGGAAQSHPSSMSLFVHLLHQMGGPAVQTPDPGALRLQASRSIEQWVGAEVGIRNIRGMLLSMVDLIEGSAGRPTMQTQATDAAGCLSNRSESHVGSHLCTRGHWLLQLHDHMCLRDGSRPAAAGGAELPSSVRDYRLARVAQAVLDACKLCCDLPSHLHETQPPDEMQAHAQVSGLEAVTLLLPSESMIQAADMLKAICDGRLLPTPWLDEYGEKELGVAAHQLLSYRYSVSTLTEEEMQFPELFRSSIKGKEEKAGDDARALHEKKLRALQAQSTRLYLN